MTRALSFCRLLGVVGLAAMVATGEPLISTQAQEPQAPATFRTRTDLLTVDAVVIDRDGRHVTDLTLADFVVTLKGRDQPLRQAVYVPLRQTTSAASATEGTAPPVPALSRPGGTRSPGPLSRPGSATAPSTRILAIVIDDLGLSFESTAHVRLALERLVAEQLQPTDLVAILRTSAGVGALQQFTTDPRLLRAAIERVRWTVTSRAGVSAFTPLGGVDAMGGAIPGGGGTAENDDEDSIDGLRTSMLTAGSLGALEYVIRGVESLPGRKSVVFVSDGFQLFTRAEGYATRGNDRIWNAFTRVMDRANRAGVVVYSMDARGLQTGGLNADDNVQPPPDRPGRPGGSSDHVSMAQQTIVEPAKRRAAFLRDSQEALRYLAEQTGGFATVDTNDLPRGFARVLDDLRGYYLLGIERTGVVPTAWDPGEVAVRVTRPGLRVRARRGLFGPADTDRPRSTAPADPLMLAALSPFGTGTMDVRVTALFGHDGKGGSYVRSLFFMDPAGIAFARGADGRHDAQLALLLLAIGDNGQPVAAVRQGLTLRLTDVELAQLRQRGLLYNARLPITGTGGFQLRAAVRDERSGATGSGSQFFEIPKVGKGALSLSGVVMTGSSGADPRTDATARLATTSGEALDGAVLFEPGVRIFTPGTELVYTCEIYDGLSAPGRRLWTSTALLRDGREFHKTAPSPVSARQSKGALRVVPVAGTVTLGPRIPPGSYTLQVSVGDERGGRVVARARQFVDFEVRR